MTYGCACTGDTAQRSSCRRPIRSNGKSCDGIRRIAGRQDRLILFAAISFWWSSSPPLFWAYKRSPRLGVRKTRASRRGKEIVNHLPGRLLDSRVSLLLAESNGTDHLAGAKSDQCEAS